jgi:hypothetical protein
MTKRGGKQWSKIYRDTGESERLTALLAKNPLAEALYWRLKAHLDDFGRCTADPRKLAVKLCPNNAIDGSVTVTQISEAVADMETCAVVRVYEVEGEPYLEAADYYNHDAPAWQFVGGPEYPAPPWWTPPEALVGFILANHRARNVTLLRYGLTNGNCPDELRFLLTPTIVEPPSNDPAMHVEPTLNVRSTDVVVDQTRPDQTRQTSSPAADAAPDPPKVKRMTAAEREAVRSAEAAELRTHFDPEDLEAVDDVLVVLAHHTINQRDLTATEERNAVQELLGFRQRPTSTGEAFRYGCAQAVRVDARTTGYVREAMSGYRPQRTSGPGLRLDVDPPQSRENAAISAILDGKREPIHE